VSTPAARWADDGLALSSGYWLDPHPEIHGLLSADAIRRYHEVVKPLIDPWDPARLKPASYELTVGPEFLVDEKEGVATSDEWIHIPPNALVFVSVMERLRLPLYLAASFNLHIDFIYRGLLLGTGPQVDPGFRGVLSCPIHNITNESVRLRVGQPFAKIEFLKISPLVAAEHMPALSACKSFSQVELWANNARADGCPVLPLLNPSKLWREPIYGYVGDRRVSSSVKGIDERVATIEGTYAKLRLAAVVGIFSFLSIVIALIALNFTYFNAKVEPLAKQTAVSEQQRAVDAAQRDASAGADRIRDLQAAVRQLKRQVRRLSR
jgi:deoxycytidine triphosphate deaminase